MESSFIMKDTLHKQADERGIEISMFRLAGVLLMALLAAGCMNGGPAANGPAPPGFGAPEPNLAEETVQPDLADPPSARADSSADRDAGREPAPASAPVLLFVDAESGDARSVPAPESQVVRLAHDRANDRYAIAFFAGDAFVVYDPADDRWHSVPFSIAEPGMAEDAETREDVLLHPQEEAARWMLPRRLSPFFHDGEWVYLSLDDGLFRLNGQTGVARRIWQAPEGRGVYGMAASPDGAAAAVLLSREDMLGPEADLLVVDLADGSILHERKDAAYVPKSDGFLAYLDVTWLDDGRLAFETWVRVEREYRTDWQRGRIVLDMQEGTAEFRTVPVGTRRFAHASGLSRYAVEAQETREVVLLNDDRAGTLIEDVLAVDGDALPAEEPALADGRKLESGILLGWMHDRWVVLYRNEANATIEDVFR